MDFEQAKREFKTSEDEKGRKLERALEEWRIEYMEAATKGGQNLILRLRLKAAIYHTFGDDRMAEVYNNIARTGLARPRCWSSKTPLEIHRFREVRLLSSSNGSHK